MPKITVDGKEIEVPGGITVLQAWNPRIDLESHRGSLRPSQSDPPRGVLP